MRTWGADCARPLAYSILTDLLCSFLPLLVVWKVRMPLKSKLMVCGLMSLGLL